MKIILGVFCIILGTCLNINAADKQKQTIIVPEPQALVDTGTISKGVNTGTKSIERKEQQKLEASLEATQQEMELRQKVEDEFAEKNIVQAKLEQEKISTQKPEEKSILHKILFYIPNRLIDLCDIVSLKLGFGPEVSTEFYVTKWFAFGGSYGDKYFIGNGYNRQYGGGYYSGYNATFACVNKELAYCDYNFGTFKPYALLEHQTPISLPNEKIYSDGTCDFWQIGAHAGWIVDVDVAVHPLSIANFLTGFFFVRLTDTQDL